MLPFQIANRLCQGATAEHVRFATTLRKPPREDTFGLMLRLPFTMTLRLRDRRCDVLTAERVAMALQTQRAFDRHRALRYLELAGVPQELALRVLDRPAGHFRRFTMFSGVAHDRRKA
jgi:hypothetical protein